MNARTWLSICAGVVITLSPSVTVAEDWPAYDKDAGRSATSDERLTLGKPKWCNDTLNAMYLAYPHDGVSFGGPTPQGYPFRSLPRMRGFIVYRARMSSQSISVLCAG